MSKIKNPQLKKKFRLENDRHNVYGESDKGSRKTIPRNKKKVNRRNRKSITNFIVGLVDEAEVIESVENRIASYKLKRWKKSPDKKLSEVLRWKNENSEENLGTRFLNFRKLVNHRQPNNEFEGFVQVLIKSGKENDKKILQEYLTLLGSNPTNRAESDQFINRTLFDSNRNYKNIKYFFSDFLRSFFEDKNELLRSIQKILKKDR